MVGILAFYIMYGAIIYGLFYFTARERGVKVTEGMLWMSIFWPRVFVSMILYFMLPSIHRKITMIRLHDEPWRKLE